MKQRRVFGLLRVGSISYPGAIVGGFIAAYVAMSPVTALSAGPTKGWTELATEYGAAGTATPPGLPPNPNGPKEAVKVVLACAAAGDNLYCDRETLTPLADGTLKVEMIQYDADTRNRLYEEFTGKTDGWGLVTLSSEVKCGSCSDDNIRTAGLAATGSPADLAGGGRFQTQGRELRDASRFQQYSVWNQTCIYQASDAAHVKRDCSGKESTAYYDRGGVNLSDKISSKSFVFVPLLGIYVAVNPSKSYGDPEAVVEDYRIGTQPWHSQQVSAALAPDRKERARAFFVQAFDLYKSSDFTGAKTLLEAGLKIDPGNSTAIFTLAEIYRSKYKSRSPGDNDFYDTVRAFSLYGRVVDLDPDSANGLLAAGYLKEGL